MASKKSLVLYSVIDIREIKENVAWKSCNHFFLFKYL